MKLKVGLAVVGLLSLSMTRVAGQLVGVPREEPASLGELGLRWSTPAPGQPTGEGWRVTSVAPCSPAHRAGILPGDILLTVGDRRPGDGTPFPEGHTGTPTARYDIRDFGDRSQASGRGPSDDR